MPRRPRHLDELDDWTAVLGAISRQRGSVGFASGQFAEILAGLDVALPTEAIEVLDGGYPRAMLKRIAGISFGAYLLIREPLRVVEEFDGRRWTGYPDADGRIVRGDEPDDSPERYEHFQVLDLRTVTSDPAWPGWLAWLRRQCGRVATLEAIEFATRSQDGDAPDPPAPEVIGNSWRCIPWLERLGPIFDFVAGFPLGGDPDAVVRRVTSPLDGPVKYSLGASPADKTPIVTHGPPENWRPFFDAWRAEFGRGGVTASALVGSAEILDAIPHPSSDHLDAAVNPARALGIRLARMATSPDAPFEIADGGGREPRTYALR